MIINNNQNKTDKCEETHNNKNKKQTHDQIIINRVHINTNRKTTYTKKTKQQ